MQKLITVLSVLALTASAHGVAVSTTIHGPANNSLDAMMSNADLIAGQIGVELPGDQGWHPANPAAEIIDFTAFNGLEDVARDAGIRISDGISLAEDLEPEYVAISPDGTTAFVALQENNALGVLDLATNSFTDVIALGFKDHSVEGAGFDGSDRDDAINIATYPIFGMYQPDAIVTYETGGQVARAIGTRCIHSGRKRS